MAREATQHLGPVVLNLDGAGGSDYTIPGTLSFNTTGSTVSVELRLTDDTTTAADDTLTEGNGLTVTPGATTSYSFTIPASFSEPTHATQVYFALIVTAGGADRCYMKGTLTLSWRAAR
jgi:hypothetical protein